MNYITWRVCIFKIPKLGGNNLAKASLHRDQFLCLTALSDLWKKGKKKKKPRFVFPFLRKPAQCCQRQNAAKTLTHPCPSFYILVSKPRVLVKLTIRPRLPRMLFWSVLCWEMEGDLQFNHHSCTSAALDPTSQRQPALLVWRLLPWKHPLCGIKEPLMLYILSSSSGATLSRIPETHTSTHAIHMHNQVCIDF